MNNIEPEMEARRTSRDLQNGPGVELENQVNSRNKLEAESESQRYYRDKGTSTLDGFNRLEMYANGVDPQKREDDSYVVPNQYRLSGTMSMFGYDPVDGKKVDDIGKTGSIWTAPLRVIAGGMRDAAMGTLELIADTQPAESKLNQHLAQNREADWLQDSSGVIEDIGRDMAQFMTGYAGAGKTLAKVGMKKGYKKEIGASIAGGQTFDPAEGNIGTLFSDFGMLPETMRFLDSKMMDKEYGNFAGRMAMAVEETGLGIGIAGVGRMLKSIKGRYHATGDNMIKEGVMAYNNATGSLNHPTRGAMGTEMMDASAAEIAVTQIASGMQVKNMKVDQFLEHAAKAGIDENMAKKAWNGAAKQKLERVQNFMTPAPAPGSIARQRGNVSLFGESTLDDETIKDVLDTSGKVRPKGQGADEVVSPLQATDTQSMDKFFQKQVQRGNVQRAEYDDVIKPTIDRMKELGNNKATGEQMVAYMGYMRPEFKTITKSGEEAKFEQYIHRPNDNTLVLEYKEHLFVARNEANEGAEGYANKAHFSEPFVKGIARTSLMGKSAGPGELKDSKIYIQEMQSDSANAARKWGTWTDKKIETDLVDKFNGIQELEEDQIYESIYTIVQDTFGKPKTEQEIMQMDKFADHIQDQMISGSRVDLEHIRPHLATPSVFNEDKAWVRQTIRPVIEDAVGQSVDKIELASSDVINKRWDSHGAEALYENKYPKILKQYFKDIGVPEKDIHMPKSSKDGFWVKLPKDVMEGTKKLPQYSVAGSAPVSMKFGEEDAE